MSIRFKCKCGKVLKVLDEHIGKRAKCPYCSEILTIPEQTSTIPSHTNLPTFGRAANHKKTSLTSRKIILPTAIGLVSLVIVAGFYFWFLTTSFHPAKVTRVLMDDLIVDGYVISGETERKRDYSLYLPGSAPPIREWQVNLRLTNKTPWPINLGNDIMLVESLERFGLINGSACFTNLTTRDVEYTANYSFFLGHLIVPSIYLGVDDHGKLTWISSYGIGNYEFIYEDGRRETLDSQLMFQPAVYPPQRKEGVYYYGFGQIQNNETKRLEITLQQARWIKVFGARLQLVLPKLTITNKQQTRSYRLILYLDRDTGNKKQRYIKQQELILLEFDELAGLLENQDTDFVLRILAANWLAEEYPERCIEPLVTSAETLRKGQLLATSFHILSRLKGKGLEKCAQEVVGNKLKERELRVLAQKYLEAVAD